MTLEANTLILPKIIEQQILDHAHASAGNEACGLLGGKGNEVSHYYPVDNVASQPATAFYMSAQGQLNAMQLMREREEEIIAIFHSHPDSEAIPSNTDLELASYPGVFNIIVSLLDNPQKLNSFRYEGKKFSRIAIKVTG